MFTKTTYDFGQFEEGPKGILDWLVELHEADVGTVP